MKTKIMTYNPKDFKAGKSKEMTGLKCKTVKTRLPSMKNLTRSTYEFWATPKKVRKPDDFPNKKCWFARVSHAYKGRSIVEFDLSSTDDAKDCIEMAKFLLKAADYLEYKAQQKTRKK